MGLNVILPDNKEQLKKEINALEWLLQQENTDSKSKEIYEKTLETYKEKLEQFPQS